MPKPTPAGWPRLSSAVFYEDPAAAIEWLERAFGFATRIRVDGEDGGVIHSELVFGEAVVMVAGLTRPGGPDARAASPRQIGGRNTQSLFLYVDDVDAHCQRARAAGGKVLSEPRTTDYGEGYWVDRGYEVADPEGHRWWFAQRLRDRS
jgi:uncharacterized glyoxalase superfamily protein PhnB